MRLLSVTLLAATTAMAIHAEESIGEHYEFSEVTALVALDEKIADDEESYQYFEPLNTKFTEKNDVSRLCKAISRSDAGEAGTGPFVGHLCHIALLTKENEIVAMVSILNYNCLCDIHLAHRDAKGRIVADYEKNDFGFTSADVAKTFLAKLRKEDPAYMKSLDETYKRVGRTVEGLLFGK